MTNSSEKRKGADIPDIIGPRLPDVFEIDEEEFEKYAKIALLLFKPHRKPEHLLDRKTKYSEAFLEFKGTEYYRNSQVERILFNIDQYYSGKRRAKELRDARKEEQVDVGGEISGSEDEDYLENNDTSTDNNSDT